MQYPTIKIGPRNFEFFAAKNYINPRCVDVGEFREDLHRFKYLKRLLSTYTKTGQIQERLVLNHLIIIFNVFEQSAALNMLFTRVEKSEWSSLKTLLLFLNRLNEFDMPDVGVDLNIVNKLRNV